MEIHKLTETLRKAEDKQKAAEMKRYMKERYTYFGIQQEKRKELSREFIDSTCKRAPDDRLEIVKDLWKKEEREFQYIAIDILNKHCKKGNKEDIKVYEQLIISKSWWDTVDMLAQKHLGAHFSRFPEQIKEYTDKWMLSENIWLQRSCILFQNKYKEKTDEALLFSFIRPLTSSKEFFIQKAIGWALREYSQTNPESVRDFVAKTPMAPLSVKEGTRKLPKR